MVRRLALFGLLAGALMALAVSANAQDTYELVFPVAGEYTYTDTFGAPRSGGRTHEGTDILADKMTPVVAAASGTVGWINNEQGGDCCHMAINHDDGWSSWYIHLNNDTPGTDDGLGWGFADGIDEGVYVEAGQLIGYVGDSGNAEATVSHLHYELRDPAGVAINAYESLLIAEGVTEPTTAAEFTPPFRDDDGIVHEPNIIELAGLGVTTGCADELYCPENSVTRAQMATFLTRALELEPIEADSFDDDNGDTHEANIEALAAAGVTLGCGDRSFCPNDPVTRAQMATFLVRAFELNLVDGQDLFADDDGNAHEANIEALAAAGVTLGCSEGSYCPEDPVTRAQMATFLIRAIGLIGRPSGPLVPDQGVLLGAYSDSGLAGYEAFTGRPLDIWHMILGEDDALSGDAVAAGVDAGKVPLVTWTPGTVEAALAGDLDAEISDAAAVFAALDGPVFLRYWPGLDTAAGEDAPAIWDAAQSTFDAAGAGQVVWVWSPDILSADAVPASADWLGTTAYGDACLGGDVIDAAGAMTQFLDAAADLDDVPIMIAEWGVGPSGEDTAGQTAYIDSMAALLDERPDIAAVVAYEGVSNCDWQLTTDDTVASALVDFLADPDFVVDVEALLGQS